MAAAERIMEQMKRLGMISAKELEDLKRNGHMQFTVTLPVKKIPEETENREFQEISQKERKGELFPAGIVILTFIACIALVKANEKESKSETPDLKKEGTVELKHSPAWETYMGKNGITTEEAAQKAMIEEVKRGLQRQVPVGKFFIAIRGKSEEAEQLFKKTGLLSSKRQNNFIDAEGNMRQLENGEKLEVQGGVLGVFVLKEGKRITRTFTLPGGQIATIEVETSEGVIMKANGKQHPFSLNESIIVHEPDTVGADRRTRLFFPETIHIPGGGRDGEDITLHELEEVIMRQY